MNWINLDSNPTQILLVEFRPICPHFIDLHNFSHPFKSDSDHKFPYHTTKIHNTHRFATIKPIDTQSRFERENFPKQTTQSTRPRYVYALRVIPRLTRNTCKCTKNELFSSAIFTGRKTCSLFIIMKRQLECREIKAQ